MTLKLGKLKTTQDPRTFKLARYFVDIPALVAQMPRTWNGFAAVGRLGELWPMYGNNKLGDCVPVASAHIAQLQQANANSRRIDIDDQEVIAAYFRASGGTGAPPTSYDDYVRRYSYLDNGLDPLLYLKQWRSIGIGGHKIAAYVEVDHTNPVEMRLASWLFGGLFTGLELPRYLSYDPFLPWVMKSHTLTGDYAPGSWGGHMVNVVYTNPDGGYLATWGELVRYSWTFLKIFADVHFGVLSQDWFNAASKKAPNGFDFQTLNADLEAL